MDNEKEYTDSLLNILQQTVNNLQAELIMAKAQLSVEKKKVAELESQNVENLPNSKKRKNSK